jgi:hypothetical protein
VIVPSQAIVERLIEKLPDTLTSHPLVDRSKKTANVVYRVVDGKAVCTPVRGGASNLTHTVVLEGLEVDASVIVGPYKVLASIEADAPVEIEAEPAAAPASDELAAKPASTP